MAITFTPGLTMTPGFTVAPPPPTLNFDYLAVGGGGGGMTLIPYHL